MKKIAKFIVDKKNYIFILFLALIAYCIWGMTKVNVEYNIVSYLPSDTDTKKALDIMDEEFVTFGTAKIMVRNVSFDEALALHDKIADLDGVKSFDFKNTEDYYRQSSALFNITFDGDDETPAAVEAYNETVKILDGYDILISSSLVDNYADRLQKDIMLVLILAIVIIVIVLAFTSQSLGEIPVFLLTFGVAALLNMGTNYWFGTISFISNSVCVILQLALAIDYAIILCHRFAEEKRNSLSANEAMTAALSKAIPEIASSSLTTIAGLLALTTMALGLGKDLGLVLAKSIIMSMVSVFLFMPCIALFFSKLIDKTKHRNLVPKITAVGKFDVKARHVLPVVFLAAAVTCGYFSFKTDYVYSMTSIDSTHPSDTQIATWETEAVFGYSNQLAVLVPSGDYAMEKRVIDVIKAHAEVTEATGLSNIEITANGQTYTLTDRLTYRQFAVLMGADDDTAQLIFRAYAVFCGEDTKSGLEEVAVFEANKDIYTVSILDLCDCALDHDDFISAYLSNDADALNTYTTLRDTVKDGEAQLVGINYTRTVYNLNCEIESPETFALIETLRNEVKAVCPDAIFAGNSMSSYDLDQSFSVDNLKVSIFTIVFVFIILMLTFRSWGLPIPLTLTIQGAIFINFSFYTFMGTNLFFFCYLIVSAIQMGATIDYAIVFTNRYQTLKKMMDKKTAVVEALNQSFPTILTSGTIMAVAGFLISGVVSDPLIATLGFCLGRGVIISILCVLLVLPALMITFDKLLDKTYFKPIKILSGRKPKKIKSLVINVMEDKDEN
ncbi:MAG: MMPL family transporter [Bacteroides sp.]|nr:MMPL family transporter [Bacillota bacterium]MCM1394210.1 MMPL family transporter [[Eubacterium] siraeum]MCM1455820.1 MMPL family transporter [Bacteroides sp.]